MLLLPFWIFPRKSTKSRSKKRNLQLIDSQHGSKNEIHCTVLSKKLLYTVISGKKPFFIWNCPFFTLFIAKVVFPLKSILLPSKVNFTYIMPYCHATVYSILSCMAFWTLKTEREREGKKERERGKERERERENRKLCCLLSATTMQSVQELNPFEKACKISISHFVACLKSLDYLTYDLTKSG